MSELAKKEGDLTQKINVRSTDEVGDIADSLNMFWKICVRSFIISV